MNAKKMKEKERRRARKLAEQAWDAAQEQNFDLAEKLIRRAVDTQSDNPVLWNDQGMLLLLRAKETEAQRSFRTAISLAPNYADPFAHLAGLRAKQGSLRDAIRLTEHAVRHAPDNGEYAVRLETYRSLLACQDEPVQAPAPASAPPTPPNSDGGKWALKAAALDWEKLGAMLTQDGCAAVPALLDAATCADIRRLFDDDALFAKTVVMDRDDFGRGVYRYFKAPMPILLKYGVGGFNALHRDLRGSVYFPIQMAAVLSPNRDIHESETEGFRGGEFLFCDVPESKKSQRRTIAAGQGDALLFCTRDRLERVGGVFGLQAVKHGVSEITEGHGWFSASHFMSTADGWRRSDL